MNQKMRSRILILVAAVGLALTVKFYPKPEQTDVPKESAQTVESVMETESETLLESTEAE